MNQELGALNREAIAAAQEEMGALAWGTVCLVAVVLVAFIANLGLFAAGWMPLWAAVPIYAVLTYLSYTPLHEAAHGNINGKHRHLQWLNDGCGYLVAPIIMIPYASHKIEHFTHHRYTNQAGKDPDHVVSSMGDGLAGFVTGGLKMLWTQNSFLFVSHWRGMSIRERSVFGLEVAVSLGWRIAFLAWMPSVAAVIMLVAGYLIGAFFLVYWFSYRPHAPFQSSGRYQNTSSLIMPRWMKPIEWFWLGQNLHSIHHLFPRVPFYRYHALHRRIEPIMRAHGTPIIGIFNRHELGALGERSPVHGARAGDA